MNLRCNYCGHSFNISRDYLITAVNEARDKKQKFHAMECINCRKTIKVPVAQMARFMPRPAETEDEAAATDEEEAPAD